MTHRYRLTLMFIALAIIILVGWVTGGGFDFLTGQFWFVSGALLLILLALVDQPFFSKDANVFVNGATALVSLFSIKIDDRDSLWWIFCAWSLYLIIASFSLMAIRSRELFLESKCVQFFSRLNRIIGKPESIFSAFFLWGVFYQFRYPKDGITINSLLLFWAVFMILNVPAIAQTASDYFAPCKESPTSTGVVTAIQSPRLAIVRLSSALPADILGKKVILKLNNESKIAEGTLFEDKIVKGFRQGRIAITSFAAQWTAASSGSRIEVAFLDEPILETRPVGVVSIGSSIGRLIFEVDPRTRMHAGEVVKVQTGDADSYYQIVSGTIDQAGLEDGNASQSVRVGAGQLGCWDSAKSTFSPIDWVAPAGNLVTVSAGEGMGNAESVGRCVVGKIPNSNFPVHVHIEDSITHNTALIGVTGSGKSYLAFHLIEAYVNAGIKVLILDITRQYWQFLQHLCPTRMATVADVKAWIEGDSMLAINQLANTPAGFPKVTADYINECFNCLSDNTPLRAGVNVPAKLCIVLEEAHSLIPEWNQVAQPSDTQHVNRSARTILQGRKYGLGTLLITQRTANVTKTILNQCNTVFALRSFDQTGLDFLRNYMGEEYSQAISTLPDRTAILVGKASSSARPIILKVSDFADRWTEPLASESVTSEEESNIQVV